jgi:hypothetical protein
MPWKIDAIQKISDLDAPITSCALLAGQGVIGVLASSPARLALVPLSGGSGQVIDLPLSSPQEIALLSRDVVLVRLADNTVWALSDLAGALERRQVAVEIRALCARPQGESAVGLGALNGAVALTLSRGEVGARPFSPRGGLRACDVGEHVTYAVSDGEGGGQLRIHPGTTPELGTSSRVKLPGEAAGLDQVRGCQGLTAIYERGAAAACLVTGSGNALQARIVQLGAPVADVAVFDGSLLVAFADGRVALHDAEAIARGGELAAPRVIGAVARGLPRVIFAAAAGKLPPALWVATTAGELLRAPLHEAEAPAHEAPQATAPVEAAPVEAPPVEAPPVEAPPAVASARAEREAAERALAARVRELDEARDAWKSELEARTEERDALRIELTARTGERDALGLEASTLRGSLEASEGKVRALSAELSATAQERGLVTARLDAGAAELRTLNEEREAQRREIERLRSELRRAQADLQSATQPRPGEVTLSIDRAKETLGGVLSRIQGRGPRR